MMFTPCTVKKSLLPCVIALSSVFSGVATADPVILPPGEFINPPPPSVFCFKVTGGDVLAGGGARLQFEVLNWTGEDAYFIEMKQNEGPAAITGNTGGLFSAVVPVQPNGWHVQDLFFGEVPGSLPGNVVFGSEVNSFGLGGGPALFDVPQNPLSGIDLDPNNDLDFSDAPAIPNPVDSGFNALDGFVLDFPDLDVFERVVLQWTLFDQNFGLLDPGTNSNGQTVRNPFSFGTFQIDRASNGSIRVATYFGIGQSLGDVEAYNQGPGGFAFDQGATELGAVTLNPTALAAVPVPAAAWLFMSGLLGLVGVSRRRVTA